jgi:hypothetical protein
MMKEQDNGRLLNLVTALVGRTQEGTIEWQELDEDFVYQCDTPRAIIRIESIDRDDSGPYRVVIMNSAGREIESLSSSTLGLDPVVHEDFGTLYRLAKRQALRTDELIDDLFEDLGIPKAKEQTP